jgi:glucose-6-phosphate isomerase
MRAKTGSWPKGFKAWKALKEHEKSEIRDRHLRDLFRRDPERFGKFSVEAEGLLLDYSRNRVTGKTMKLLARLAREAGVETLRERMFAGEHINDTEDRAVLHVALRSDRDDPYFDGEFDATAAVHEVLDSMDAFVRAVHSGQYAGHGTGRRFTDVVNIGIGGSDLGIAMAVDALANYQVPGIRVHCVSNIDGTQLGDVLGKVDPGSTLFVICSKTFTTLETLTNAQAARTWFVERMGEEAVGTHFVGVSTNHAAMDAFGISPQARFGFWDWVGGRYSMCSAVGLSIALAVGMDNFRAMLAGARAMDRHFREAPPEVNLPVLLGLLSVWNTDFLGCESHAVLPYDNRLARFPAYLQQLHMESNGKRVRRDGKKIGVATGPVIWGEPGSNAQHSFYQLLHQGTRHVAVDFLAPVRGSGPGQAQHDLALANMLAQAQALAHGQSEETIRVDLAAAGVEPDVVKALVPHKVHPGNRPSTTVLFPRLDPETLGKLVALYEHKVFIESAIWGINAFDQWGVELGKKLAEGLAGAVADPENYEGGDSSTRGQLSAIQRWRG